MQDAPTTEKMVEEMQASIVEDRVTVGPAADPIYPPSPFLIHLNKEDVLARPPFPDENTPPRKRRHTYRTIDQEDAAAEADEDAISSDDDQTDEGRSIIETENKLASPSTWFTPIRPSRPHNHRKGSEYASPPSLPISSPSLPVRMPSFAQWIAVPDADEQPSQNTNAIIPDKKDKINGALGAGGVELSDLAKLYDATTAAMGSSPLSPIEKICQTPGPVSVSSEDESELD